MFPGCVTHFDVGRSRSARAVEEAMRADQMIFLVAQRDVQCDEPKKTDLYSVGTVAYVRQIDPGWPAPGPTQWRRHGRGRRRE